jgi:3-phenylpropionate/trans-cinnamate dioxygenase ferredoxin reductase subunit
MLTSSDILIIGAGQAGGCAAAALRQNGFGGTITLVGHEVHRPYERPPLSKALLDGDQADDSIFLHKLDMYSSLDLQWMSGTAVTEINTAAGMAGTSNGAQLRFDRCLIATGGRPRLLPGLAADAPNVHYLRGLDDAIRLRQCLSPDARVTVLGGGFLGLEFASTARKKGMAVTVCEAGERLLSRAAPAAFADWLRMRFEDVGVQILCGVRTRTIKSTNSGVTVELESGEVLESDLLLVAIGQEPNIELAQRAGLKIDNGIAVDSHCETSAPGIFSAGDCASHFNRFLGRRVRLESWQNAQEQAATAAKAMLGMPTAYDLVPWFWSDQLGMNIQMLGVPDPAYRYIQRGDMATCKFSIYGFNDDGLRYALAVNSGGEIRPLRNLMEADKTVDGDLLIDSSRSIRDIVKAAMA